MIRLFYLLNHGFRPSGAHNKWFRTGIGLAQMEAKATEANISGTKKWETRRQRKCELLAGISQMQSAMIDWLAPTIYYATSAVVCHQIQSKHSYSQYNMIINTEHYNLCTCKHQGGSYLSVSNNKHCSHDIVSVSWFTNIRLNRLILGHRCSWYTELLRTCCSRWIEWGLCKQFRHCSISLGMNIRQTCKKGRQWRDVSLLAS